MVDTNFLGFDSENCADPVVSLSLELSRPHPPCEVWEGPWLLPECARNEKLLCCWSGLGIVTLGNDSVEVAMLGEG